MLGCRRSKNTLLLPNFSRCWFMKYLFLENGLVQKLPFTTLKRIQDTLLLFTLRCFELLYFTSFTLRYLYFTVLYSTLQYFAILCSTLSYFVILCCTVGYQHQFIIIIIIIIITQYNAKVYARKVWCKGIWG